jgi:hypothetical protein
VTKHTYGQLLVLTLGINEVRAKERKGFPVAAAKEEKKPKMPKFKSGMEYMRWLDSRGKGRI